MACVDGSDPPRSGRASRPPGNHAALFEGTARTILITAWNAAPQETIACPIPHPKPRAHVPDLPATPTHFVPDICPPVASNFVDPSLALTRCGLDGRLMRSSRTRRLFHIKRVAVAARRGQRRALQPIPRCGSQDLPCRVARRSHIGRRAKPQLLWTPPPPSATLLCWGRQPFRRARRSLCGQCAYNLEATPSDAPCRMRHISPRHQDCVEVDNSAFEPASAGLLACRPRLQAW